jgi:5-methylcytosine-specific restriction endonuclease McrA
MSAGSFREMNSSPDWLEDAQASAGRQKWARALDLIEANAFRNATTNEVRARALEILVLAVRMSRKEDDIRRAKAFSTRIKRRLAKAGTEPRAASSLEVKARAKELRGAGISNRRAVAIAKLDSGPYCVSFYGVRRDLDPKLVARELKRLGYADREAQDALERVIHIAPETVAYDVSQSEAVQVKRRLEAAGARIRIEQQARRESGRRSPIPEAVRHEVWRRDGGRCVDCGSREDLHFDHIVPWSRGGANTARNLELRCERCNLKKGARI